MLSDRDTRKKIHTQGTEIIIILVFVASNQRKSVDVERKRYQKLKDSSFFGWRLASRRVQRGQKCQS